MSIGNYCTIVGAIFATDSRVEIGDYAFISHEVVIGDSPVAGPSLPVLHQTEPLPNPVIIVEPNVWIGARAILLGGAHIGEGSVIGACSVVTSKIPPGTIAAGNPARVVRHVERQKIAE